MTDRELEQPAVGDPADELGGTAPGFSSRREMREAGGYRAAVEPVAAPRTPKRRPARKPAKRPRARDLVRRRVATPAAPTGWRRRLSSAGVMSVVVGLLATLTIPAFADQGAVVEDLGPVAGQTFEVSAAVADTSAAASAVIRDGYETTSAADLRRLYADAIRQQNLAAYMASGAREMGDDYPWPDALHRGQGGGLSPLRYYYRECVDFVAWRLNRDAGSTSAPFVYDWSNLAQSSAYGWKRAWESHGWTTSPVPVVGSVAWTPGGNHVAYVSGILADGSVALEEYNYSTDHGYGQRIIQPEQAYYLYPPGT